MTQTGADAVLRRSVKRTDPNTPHPMPGAFWAFSMALYGQPGVSAACIALQDEHGADVDMVLFALWCATSGHALTSAEVAAVDDAVAGWRESVLQPLRAARRALKPPPAQSDAATAEALRRQLLTAELEAERLQQQIMEAYAPSPGTADPERAAQDNLARVAHVCAFLPDPAQFGVLLLALDRETGPG